MAITPKGSGGGVSSKSCRITSPSYLGDQTSRPHVVLQHIWTLLNRAGVKGKYWPQKSGENMLCHNTHGFVDNNLKEILMRPLLLHRSRTLEQKETHTV